MDYGRYLEDMYEAQTNMIHDEFYRVDEQFKKGMNDE